MSLTPGVRLNVYEVISLIGAGGMGEVYRGRDVRLGRDVALKVLASDLAGDPARLQRFEQEARAAAALNHPNILAVFDIGRHDGASYIVQSCSKARPCVNGWLANHYQYAKLWITRRRSRTGSQLHMSGALCIVISSLRTFSSPPTGM